MTTNSINELDLLLPMQERKHYVSFDDEDDLKNKLSFYLKNEEHRLNIARNGHKLFIEVYDYSKHCQDLKKLMTGTT